MPFLGQFSVAKRFKNFRRFVYNYEAETFNGVNGATDNKSGPKVFCKVCLPIITPKATHCHDPEKKT